ncbi:MAG: hypothetical protein ACRD8Z_15655 [Nitrososphaeraceae archaeon]
MHKLDRLEIIIRERITSVRAEIELATNASLNRLDIENLKEEVQFLEWSSQHIQLITAHNNIQWAVNKETQNQQELEDIIRFEQLLRDRIHGLILTLDLNDSQNKINTLRNEINTLECVLGHLSALNYDELPSSTSEIIEVNRTSTLERIC